MRKFPIPSSPAPSGGEIKLAWVNPAPPDPMSMTDEELEFHFRKHCHIGPDDIPDSLRRISENDRRSLKRWFK